MKDHITRWGPFKDPGQLQKRLASVWQFDPFGNVGRGEPVTTAEWSPRVVVSEDAREYLIKAEMPGMRKEDVKVSVQDGILTVSGERKFEKKEKGERCQRIERECGSFARSLALPAGASGKKLTAQFKNAVLRVHLPKDRRALSSKAIEIKAGQAGLQQKEEISHETEYKSTQGLQEAVGGRDSRLCLPSVCPRRLRSRPRRGALAGGGKLPARQYSHGAHAHPSAQAHAAAVNR